MAKHLHLVSLGLLSLSAACGPAAKEPPKLGEPFSAASAAPFENPGGMWLPEQLTAQEHREALTRLGVKLKPEALASPSEQPLSSVVFLGGCSASFVSASGLIITNHHCVTQALQHNSTKEDPIVETGFLASDLKSERSNGPSARVYISQRSTDITKLMRQGLAEIVDPEERQLEIERRQKALVKTCEEKTPHTRCQVSSFFGGGEHRLLERLELRDIRLVYAPHRDIGSFGGDIDNWRWPRHTADYAFYRAYVGPDGNPADYSPENIPYQPRSHLPIAKAGLKAGDFVMVAGFPGSTSRLATAFEVKQATDWFYPKRIAMTEHYLPILRALGEQDADARIKASSLEAGLSNVSIYTKGALEGLTLGGTAQVKSDAEKTLWARIQADPKLKERFGALKAELDRISKAQAKTRDLDIALTEILRLSSLLGAANTLIRHAEEQQKLDAERALGFQDRDRKLNEQQLSALDKRYSPNLERSLLVEALGRAAKLPQEGRPRLLNHLFPDGNFSHANLVEVVGRLIQGTQITNEKARSDWFIRGNIAELRRSEDPIIQAALTLREDLAAKEHRERIFQGEMAIWRPLYVEALRAISPERKLAPDANRTLRISYGTVRGYAPKPGAPIHQPFTWLPEVLPKISGEHPFAPPPRLAEAIKSGKRGRYIDAERGEVPVNFLADLDITGGNSGSATLNGDGELVGLAFDGNYEAMASDWLFMPHITRSIHVDIRYVLWLMDAVDSAHHLLREMGVEPEFE